MVGRFRTTYSRLLLLLLLMTLPAAVQAQLLYTTTNGTITITGYTGPGGDVLIPGTVNDLPVTGIGSEAFLSTTCRPRHRADGLRQVLSLQDFCAIGSGKGSASLLDRQSDR